MSSRSRIKRMVARWLSPAARETLWVSYWRLRTRLSLDTEPEIAKIGRFVAPGDWVVDIGVNMGQYAVRLRRLVGPGGKVIGFEPSPAAFRLTQRIVDGVELHRVALGSEPGKVVLASYADDSGLVNHGISRVVSADDARASAATEVVDCVRLDDALADRGRRIAFVKCDVEGFEVEVFKGALDVVRKDLPVLLVEIESPRRYEDLFSVLGPLGYVPHQLARAGHWQRIEGYGDAWTNNFLWVPPASRHLVER